MALTKSPKCRSAFSKINLYREIRNSRSVRLNVYKKGHIGFDNMGSSCYLVYVVKKTIVIYICSRAKGQCGLTDFGNMGSGH